MERDFKTHPMQWRVIIDYMEENPSIIRPKFGHSDGDANANNQLWNQLASNLNAMGFGIRSAEKWKAAVTRWKSKVKTKAAQLRIEGEKTGGGPSKAIPLNDTEERLMALLGWRAVTGDPNVEFGMPPPPTPPASSSVSMPPLTPIRPLGSPSTSRHGTKRVAGDEAAATSTAPTPKRIRRSTEKTRRFVSLNRMHTETQEQSAQQHTQMLERLSRIEANTERIGNAFERVANVLETILPNISLE